MKTRNEILGIDRAKLIETFTLLLGSVFLVITGQDTEKSLLQTPLLLAGYGGMSYLNFRITRPWKKIEIDYDALHKSFWVGLIAAWLMTS